MTCATPKPGPLRFDVGVSAGKRDQDQREAALRRLMRRQHGLVHRDQAIAAGMSKSAIHRRVGSGAWIRHYRCVYGVAGAPPTFEQRGLAACMATGPSAVLSHLAAGAMWGWCAARGPLHVTVAGQVTARPAGVVMHRTQALAKGDVGRLRRVPVTSPVRTLLDLSAVLREGELDEILQLAVTTGCVVPEKLRHRMGAHGARRRRGAAAVRRLLPETERRSHVPTPLERDVARLLAEVGPAFVREHPIYVDGRVFYADFAFPPFRVAVEVDGRRWHSDARSFERDREKHNALTSAGWRVIRVTERQVRADPQRVRDRVRGLLVRG